MCDFDRQIIIAWTPQRMPDQDPAYDPLQYHPDPNPWWVFLNEVRRYCRAEVRALRTELRDMLAKMQQEYPALCPDDTVRALDEYMDPPIDDQVANSPGLPPPAKVTEENAVTGTASPADSDSELMAKFYVNEKRALDILEARKKTKSKALIKKTYPVVNVDEVYNDAFHKIAETRRRGKGRYTTNRPFDPWLNTIIHNCAKDALRRRTPLMVLVTPFLAGDGILDAASWVITLDEESMEFEARTLRELQDEVQRIQNKKNRKRWKWTFDVVQGPVAEFGLHLQFRVFTHARLILHSADGKYLLFPATLGFSGEATELSADAARAARDRLSPIMREFHDAIREMCPVRNQVTLLLCDLLDIPLEHAVGILQAGQVGDEDKYPPYGTVGQWRSTAKGSLVNETGHDREVIDKMLRYASCAYYDPNLE